MRFTRLGINSIAKAIRNTPISNSARSMLVRNLVEVFAEDNPLFDAARFRQLANGKLDKDPLFGWREKDEPV